MNSNLIIRKAESSESVYLNQLALRSKSYWGYSEEFMLACQEELQVTNEKLSKLHYCIAQSEDKIVGFYALEFLSKSEYELEALFIDPKYIGKGFGKALITHAKCHAKKMGAKSLIIQGDPNANKFYLAAGGVLTGELESGSIPGRFLPIFCISLNN